MRPRLLLMVFAALLVSGLAALVVLGASPSEVANAADDVVPGGASSVAAGEATLDDMVPTVAPPEQLGFDAGVISPTWASSLADKTALSGVATGQRTLYVTGWNLTTANMDLRLAKYVDGALKWQRAYDGAAHGWDYGRAVAARGGAIYTTGLRQSTNGDSDLVLIRWNSDGERVWTRGYDSGSRLGDEGVDVAVDADGNVTVLGQSTTPTTDRDWVLVSYRPDGTRRYVRRYDGPAHRDDSPTKMLLDSEGRVYAIGYSKSATNGYDALVAKYSQTGALLWTRRFNGTGNGEDMALALRARPGGGVYVAGHTTSVGTGKDGLLLAYTAAGTRLFAVAEPGADPGYPEQYFTDLEVMPGGDIICGGSSAVDYTDHDRFWATYNSSGALQERSRQGTPYYERITALGKDSQGGVYLTGSWGVGVDRSQVYTQRLREGGTTWSSLWPSAPTTWYQPAEVVTNGANAYIVGTASSEDYEVIVGYVY